MLLLYQTEEEAEDAETWYLLVIIFQCFLGTVRS